MKKELPIIATRGIVVFPDCEKIIDVGRKISLNAITTSLVKHNSQILIVSQKEPDMDVLNNKDQIYSYGTLASIEYSNDNKMPTIKRIIAKGISRIKLTKVKFESDITLGEYKIIKDVKGSYKQEEGLKRTILHQIQSSLNITKLLPDSVMVDIPSSLSGEKMANLIANYLRLPWKKKQELLEEINTNDRLKLISELLEEEKDINEIENSLNASMRKNLDKQQKEFILREKLKAIKAELGEISSKDKEIDEMISKANSGILPDEVKTKILEEIKKYESMPIMAAESNLIKSFIDCVLEVPWKKISKDSESLIKAKRILNQDHYGLEKIKDRIIEFLAVKQNTKSLSAPIICFVGPPGVGKTSLAQSIARAINRKFVKISVGGVKDEAEIRGHRRTYIGAMPGKIIKAIIKSGVSNPVLLIDEIDKMSSDYKGDPTSAMLEVLDPEQNKKFQDHYLEFEYDLSKVIFVVTANYYQNIPSPLLDRMEVIELHSYTDVEKINIAKKHLIKKTLKNNGLTEKQFQINDKELKFIINNYTMESGVRNLIRALDKIARKLVVLKLKNKLGEENTVDIEQIKKLLGTPIYDKDRQDEKPQIGAVTALAFTQYGGATMSIEATKTLGKGNLKLTGQLADVMSESANIAFTYVKANAKKFGIKTDFSKFDIHIHAAAGAIPKDGPSAGVTFATAIISMLTKIPVSQTVAMTGELTLRGYVLPIGGLKEKSLAALRMGIKTIFIPKENKKNLSDFKSEVKNKIKYYPVSDYIEIFNKLFKNKLPKSK